MTGENYSTLALTKLQDQTPEPTHESLPRHNLLSYLHSIFHTSTQNLELFLNSFFPSPQKIPNIYTSSPPHVPLVKGLTHTPL
jgi:hypothetical protein